MKDISVIMPVYNKGDFLQKSISSVLNSTLKNIEIICIDDASTDNSIQILKDIEKKDSRVLFLKNEQNYGVSYTRNKGIQHARGKYVFFLDADDFIEKNTLEIYWEELEKNHAQGCFIGLKDKTGEKIGIKEAYNGVFCGRRLLDKFVENNEEFLYACGAVWERKFLIENNITFDTLKIGEGGLFILKALLKVERVICSKYAGYCYVINQTSTNQSQNAMQEAAIGQAMQLIFMIKNIKSDGNNEEITHFLKWYTEKHIGGIKNIQYINSEQIRNKFPNEEDRYLFSLIRGNYLENHIDIDDDMEKIIIQKGKVYLYGAGYETFDTIKYCHQIGVEILGVLVTSKGNNPDNIYGFHVSEFNENLIQDKSIPILITAHKIHQKEIKNQLTKCGIENIACLREKNENISIKYSREGSDHNSGTTSG